MFVIAERRVYVYRVNGLQRVSPDDVRSIYVRSGDALTLVTCANWDAGTGRYTQRLLVRATLSYSRPIVLGG